MSYSFTFSGDENEVGKQFDDARDSAAANGLIEPEQRDIDEARDLVMRFANTHGPVSGSCNGHWSIKWEAGATPNDPSTANLAESKFAAITISIYANKENA